MKIDRILVNYFKFFTNGDIQLNKKNALIFGENGSGKSSLYYALYRSLRNRNKYSDFKNFHASADKEPSIQIFSDDNNQIELEKQIYPYTFFINYLIINKIIEEENLFISIEKILQINFPRIFQPLLEKIKEIKKNVPDFELKETQEKIFRLRDEIQKELNQLIGLTQEKVNEILKAMETKISLELVLEREVYIKDEGISTSIEDPIIKIKINGKENIKKNFNEAILKICGLAIWFALIELEEKKNPSTENDLRLLVLDDVMMSIDMGNRLFVTKYLFESDLFSNYQIIFMTHSIEFYKMLLRYLDVNGNKGKWLEISAYSQQEENFNSSVFIHQDEDYTKDAEKSIADKNFQNAGNSLRKELEKQIKKITFELGESKEYKLNTLLEKLMRREDFYKQPHELLDKIFKNPNIATYLESENLKVPIDKIQISKLKFLNELILNKYSHDDQRESYSKELEYALKVMKEIREFVSDPNKRKQENEKVQNSQSSSKGK